MSDMIGKKVHIENKYNEFAVEVGYFPISNDYIGIIKDKLAAGYILENIETNKTHKVESFTNIKFLDDNTDLELYAYTYRKEEEKKDQLEKLERKKEKKEKKSLWKKFVDVV